MGRLRCEVTGFIRCPLDQIVRNGIGLFKIFKQNELLYTVRVLGSDAEVHGRNILRVQHVRITSAKVFDRVRLQPEASKNRARTPEYRRIGRRTNGAKSTALFITTVVWNSWLTLWNTDVISSMYRSMSPWNKRPDLSFDPRNCQARRWSLPHP